MFGAWRRVWLSPEFRDWNIEACVPRIRCPILALQGTADPYGTVAQLAALRRLPAAACDIELIDCGHAPHRERPDETATRIAGFVARVLARQD